MGTPHDTGYKELFSHAEFVEALLDRFVPQQISSLLDYTTLNSEPGHYITPLFEERIEDSVWSVQFKPDSRVSPDSTGQPPGAAGQITPPQGKVLQGSPSTETQTLYLYILLEFQSKTDKTMPLRMLHYSASFYHQLLKQKKLKSGQKLPAVFPLVLYNGRPDWTPPTNMQGMLQPVPAFMQRFQPQLDYHLIDVKNCQPGSNNSHDNLLQLVFNVENAMTPETMQRVAEDIADAVREHPDRERIDRILVRWFKRFLYQNQITVDLDAIHQVQEIPPMLANRVETWFEQWKQEGEQTGEQKGRTAAMQQTLQKLIQLKFGDLPQEYAERIQQAEIEQLELWTERILFAEDVSSLFA